jgi:tetratricopeptide (TPR) repeat protein
MILKTSLKKCSLTLLLGLVLTSCATLPPADPKLSATLHEEAIRMTTVMNYPEAISKYDEAIRYNPLNSDLYLQQAELLETIQQFDIAARPYQQAIDRLPEDHLELENMHYRLGLLRARDKGQHRKARQNLTQIEEPSMRFDLEGFILLHAGDPDGALKLFSQALKTAPGSEQQARVYYHASHAHYAKKDIIESKNALFHAVNNARGLALKQHIRIFFDQIR